MKKRAIILSLLLVIAVLASVMVIHKRQNKPKNEVTVSSNSDTSVIRDSVDSNSQEPTIQQLSNNVSRKNDASKLLAAAAEFISNNNGSLPTRWHDGMLGDDLGSIESNTNLSYYNEVVVEQGEIAQPSEDKLELITGVKCTSNSQVVYANSRAVVARYRLSTGLVCTEL